MSENEKLIIFFNKNKSVYEVKEIGGGTVNFVKKVFTDFLGLKEEAKYKTYKRNSFTHESTKKTGSNSRSDFIINYKGVKIVVEVEKTGSIEPGIKQIKEYMKDEKTLYGILTDGETWYFYNKGFDESLGKFGTNISKNLEDFILNSGKQFFDSFFETKNYYINFFNRIDLIENFNFGDETLQKDLKNFHKELIEVAEKLKADFDKSGIFEGDSEKEVIQTIYSFIIQFLLIKIIQDKKKLELINKKEFVKLLDEDKYSELANSIFNQINWLGEFYTSYQNEQKHLIDKILDHYQNGPFGSNINFEAIQGFLDLYIFIFKFNFKNIKQDIFGAVYENYLKELYKDDNSKKGQVFTPPEIVDFMLDEIGYTSKYIEEIIVNYIKENGFETLGNNLLQNEHKPDFNIPGLSIIDPACGSGTFLYKASSRIVNAIYSVNNKYKLDSLNPKYPGILSENLILNNIFGFDIEAFPLYLAEMNIIQTLLWFNIDSNGNILNKIDKQVRIFSTTDSIGEFANMQNSINSILENLEKPAIFSVSEKVNPKAISELKLDIINGELENKLDKFLVSYIGKSLENIDKTFDKKISKIENLAQFEQEVKKSENPLIQARFKQIIKDNKKYFQELKILANKYKTSRTKFDFVIGNPPYIQMLKQGIKNKIDINIFLENDHLSNYAKHSGANINIFHKFIILGYFLLRNNGKLSYIIPGDLVSQLSANQIRNFLRDKTFINKIFSFGDNKLFVERGLNQKFEVATTSCIINFQKKLEKNKKLELFYYEKRDVSYFFENINKNKIENIFNIKVIKQEKLFENWKINFNGFDKILNILNVDILSNILDEKDGIITKSTEIDKKEKERKLNITVDGKQYFYFIDFKNIYRKQDEIEFIYDIKNKSFNDGRVAPIEMLKKKYKIIWNKINNKKKKLEFMFTDYPIIWHNNGYLAFGSDDKKLTLFYFELFSSYFGELILKNVVSEQGNTYQLNGTDINNFRVPKIDSEIKEKLKEKLIENGEKIVEVAKSGKLENLKYRDLLEFGIDGIDEVILGVKEKFKFLDLDLEEIKRKDLVDEKVSDEILEKINKNNDLEKLERQRDLLVYCLYFGKENAEKDFIDLSKINIENILESEEEILGNKGVKVVSEV